MDRAPGRLADRPDRQPAARPRARARGAAGVAANIGRGDRIVIIGRTGSGKSVLVRTLLASYSRAAYLDPKGRATLGDWPIVYGSAAFTKAWPATTPRIIVRPGPGEDRHRWLDDCAWHVFRTGETAFALDDTMGVVSANRSSPGLDACHGQGREIGITSYTCTQRPSKIPPAIMSECDHVFVFTLNRRDDRETVADIIGDYSGPAVWHGFVYWHGTLTNAVDCRPLSRVP